MDTEILIKSNLKFRIKELLNKLPKSDYDKAIIELPGLVNMHPKAFNALINTKISSEREPSSLTMIRLASFFNCLVDELYTIQPGKISIEDLYISAQNSTADEMNLAS